MLSISWHNGQRNMGWTECCVITCILRRFRSVLVNLQYGHWYIWVKVKTEQRKRDREARGEETQIHKELMG